MTPAPLVRRPARAAIPRRWQFRHDPNHGDTTMATTDRICVLLVHYHGEDNDNTGTYVGRTLADAQARFLAEARETQQEEIAYAEGAGREHYSDDERASLREALANLRDWDSFAALGCADAYEHWHDMPA